MKIFSIAAAAAVAMLAPLLLTSPSRPSSQAPEERHVIAFMRLEPLEGQNLSDATHLLQRIANYHQAHYADAYRLSIFKREFAEGEASPADGPLATRGAWFAEYESINRCFATWTDQRADDGWGALMQEFERIFGPPRRTLLFTLNGVGSGDGKVIRILRTTLSPDSKIPVARRFAGRLAQSLSARHEGLQVRTFSADVQDPARIYWCFDYSGGNVGWESTRLELLADDDYVETYRDAEGLFVDEEATMAVFTRLL